jgi:hypothetical protein
MADAEVIRYVPADRRLGRHVNHDPRSRRFPMRASGGVLLRSVRWQRRVPIWDQGDLGSCTGNAGLGCLATDPFFATVDDTERNALGGWSEQGAVALYAAATTWDNFPGSYPPEDTGSDGLSVAKALTNAGMIAGYRHAFSLADLVSGLMVTPCIVGTEWLSGMYDHDPLGIIHPSGRVEGGHEYICDEYVQAGDTFGTARQVAAVDLLGFTNSWGTGWADDGRHFMPAAEFGELLARQGDATFFLPAGLPAPEPVPVPVDPDQVLADALRVWAHKPDASSSKRQRGAVRVWLAAKGL